MAQCSIGKPMALCPANGHWCASCNPKPQVQEWSNSTWEFCKHQDCQQSQTLAFGCPAYTLSQELQTDTSIYHKRKARSRVGVYLGRPPQYASDVSLVLETGLVSPSSMSNWINIPDTDGGRSQDATIMMAAKVQFCSSCTSCKELSQRLSHQNWQDSRSTSTYRPWGRSTRWRFPAHSEGDPRGSWRATRHATTYLTILLHFQTSRQANLCYVSRISRNISGCSWRDHVPGSNLPQCCAWSHGLYCINWSSYHVSAWSHEGTWQAWVYQSRAPRDECTTWWEELLPHFEIPGSKGCHHPGSSLANEAQTTHSNKGSLQVESRAQHWQVLPGQGTPLWGHLCTSCYMGFHPPYPCHCHCPRLAFQMPFTQAPFKCNMYMDIPKGFVDQHRVHSKSWKNINISITIHYSS